MGLTSVCISGYSEDFTCIRPVLPFPDQIQESWLFEAGNVVIRPFAQVELDLAEGRGRRQPPHTEDWIIDPHYRIHLGMLLRSEQKQFLARNLFNKVEDI